MSLRGRSPGRAGPDRFAAVRSTLLKTVSKCGARGVFSLKKQLQQYAPG